MTKKGSNLSTPEKPWAQPASDIAEKLDVSIADGLSEQEVKQRRERYGENRLRKAERRSALQILVEQFQSLLVALLAVAAALSMVFGDFVEGFAIIIVILINAVVGFLTELQAVRSMEALQELSRVMAKVRRNGTIQEIQAEEIVPGDILVLSGGDMVTADVRLVEANKLQVDESALTGESVPVTKQTEPIESDAPIAERATMAYKGTAITRGSGEGVVIQTGMDTELGQISALVAQAEEEATPLEKRLENLGRKLIWVTVGIAVLVAVSGIIAGREITLMIETAIALAVASVPEGLPIVATVALARGMWRMARRNAIIRRLSAVETLGSTNVILTDKTGTLTENRMTVVRILLPGEEVEVTGRGLELSGKFQKGDDDSSADGHEIDSAEDEQLERALRIGVLCNNADLRPGGLEELEPEDVVGDPLEVALLVAGLKADIDRSRLLEKMPEEREVAFDAQTKMMATYHKMNGEYLVAAKGALEPVMQASSHILNPDSKATLDEETRKAWGERNESLAAEGLRVIALAEKTVTSEDADPYEDLTFVGLAAMLDPPRKEVRPAMESCHRAGIRVVMITGDQPATAREVALEVGLVDEEDAPVVHGEDLGAPDELDAETREAMLQTQIFARVSPKQKLDLISLHQDAGRVVAMTGDGVNDAPALKKADIGIAMGQRGTQVAQEASDMILKDDAFSTIVTAVQQGRAIFGNIRNFVLYLLSCNVSEILVVGFASVINAPLPIRPLQILFLNLVTDVFPALALGVGEGGPHLMERPPRDPDEPILARSHWITIGGYSSLITLAVLGALGAGLVWQGYPQDRAVTLSFLTLAFAQLWHVFDMRDPESHLFRNDITQNPWIWGAIAITIGLLLAAVYVPFLADLLSLVRPGATGWAIVAVSSFAPVVIGQIISELRHALS